MLKYYASEALNPRMEPHHKTFSRNTAVIAPYKNVQNNYCPQNIRYILFYKKILDKRGYNIV